MLLVVALTFCLVGCGNSAKDLAGKYKAVTVKSSGEEIDLSAMESLGMTVSLTIDEDGNGTMEFSFEKQ